MTLFKKENSLAPKPAQTTPKRVIPHLKQPTLINGVLNLNHNTYNHTKDNRKNQPAQKVSNGNLKITNHPAKTKQNAKVYHWQSDGAKKSSADDMVLLTKISEAAITENLKKRLMEDKIYTYIGPVLVAVNPFKQMLYFGEKEVLMYQGAAQYEVPPHIYALADGMYRNMLIDNDSQCVIISGESGAGKTVSAKYIMNYITRISGGGSRVQNVKEIILESNPLLEAFGNAKTIRNNNSSRFGKYIEIEFSRGGEPQGGKISNFLLEKSRVHFLNEKERNFHIFYQLCASTQEEMRSQLGITSPDYYTYLSQSGVYKVEGTNDSQELNQTLKAMEVMGINWEGQTDILRVVAAILHMGNIVFVENDNKGQIEDPSFLQFPAHLLGINIEDLNQKLTSRVFDSKWGSVSERVNVTLNVEQAQFARDAWAKGLYARLFDYIVKTVNTAMETNFRGTNLGILDIYGFEIFDRNGFEQFCINYVNEKLQQIFIELTLKNEQEEYKKEGIHWKQIDFFNNKIVCDLIESKRPPGIFSVLDDTVATMSAVSEGADEDFRNKMTVQVGHNPHYQTFKDGFTIKHFAGKVNYHVDGFCEKNRDVLFVDIIEVMQSSSNAFIRSLFPEDISSTVKGRPSTVAAKIRTQANSLVTKLSSCFPHYIRCIKPNETKRPKDWDDAMVKEQVEYLGLKENVKVKRAGFAYRRPFEKFVSRYAILAGKDLSYLPDQRRKISFIMHNANLENSQYQLGISKCFIKDPESLYMLEECRERKFDYYARFIQRAFRKYFSNRRYMRDKIEACDVLLNRKQRRANSVNRNFFGDYIGVHFKPSFSKLIPKREKVEFSETVLKYDRKFKSCKRDLILTNKCLYLIGLTKIQKGPQKGQVTEVIKRKIEIENITEVSLSTYADNFLLLRVKNDVESLLSVNFKTEFLMVLNRKTKELCGREVPRTFVNSFVYKVKKTRFSGGGTRRIEFSEGERIDPVMSSVGTTLSVKIGPNLPAGTRLSRRSIAPDISMYTHQLKNNNNSIVRRTSKGNASSQNVSSSILPIKQVSPPHAQSLKKRSRRFHGGLTNEHASVSAISHSKSVKLPPANQQWPASAPPPPNQPAPADQPVVTRRLPVTVPKPSVNQARALYSYNARDVDELTFVEGDILELIADDESGWWTCRFEGKKGFCPGNYLERI